VITEYGLSDKQALFPSADKVNDLIDSEPDPAARSLLRLVYGEFVMALVDGKLPQDSVDLHYCFAVLQSAFRRKDALETALKGELGDADRELEWS
jgi:hypothetical protein